MTGRVRSFTSFADHGSADYGWRSLLYLPTGNTRRESPSNAGRGREFWTQFPDLGLPNQPNKVTFIIFILFLNQIFIN